MKILHYMFGIPPVRGGGLIKYATDLMKEEMELGQTVYLLIPGKLPKNKKKSVKIRKIRKYNHIKTFAIYNPLPISMGNGILDVSSYMRQCNSMVYRDFLDKVEPDVIHVHSLMGIHLEFFEEATKKNIPVIFTTHDYFGLCPCINLLKGNSICEDMEWANCERCCRNAYSDFRCRLEQSESYRIYRHMGFLLNIVHFGVLKNSFTKYRAPERFQCDFEKELDSNQVVEYLPLKKYYEKIFSKITLFHFNSYISEKVYKKRLGNINGVVEAISHFDIKDQRKRRLYNGKIRMGYIGGWRSYKGFDILLKVVARLYKEYGDRVELHLYSDNQMMEEKYIVNHKSFNSKQIKDVMEQFDVLIVPSIWAETFGFVLLEALSYGVPVVVSQNVGAAEIVSSNNGIGFIYDGSQEELFNTLKKMYENKEMIEDANQKIMCMNWKYSMINHTRRMIEVYEKLLN